MIEYGVFNREGCIDSQIWSPEEAEREAAAQRAAGDEDAYAAEMCPEHRDQEQPKATCEECFSE